MEEKMTARQYLGQAYRLDQRINSKLMQLALLRGNAMNLTANLKEISIQTSPDNARMESTLLKIIDQEREIDEEIDRLVDLKVEIKKIIDRVENIECRLILELRYLCFRSWEEIAVEMDYSIDNVFRIHRKALEILTIPSMQ